MKFKRILAAITALTVASAAVLTLTIVSADSRDRVASFDKAKLNDYDLVDYEDMVITDENEPSEPEPEDTDQGEPAEPTDPADTEEGEVTTPSSEDTEPEGPDPEDTGEPEETDEPEVTVPEGEETEPEETEPEETDPEESTEPEESQPEENDPEETLKPGDTVVYGDLTLEVLEDGTLSVMGYIGDDEVVIVPGDIEGKAVTAIADGAFAGCPALRGAYIPASVTFIGSEAFAWLSDGDEDSEYQHEQEDQHDFIIFGHLSSYAEAYAAEKGITFFAVGGVSVTDELWGVEVIFPDGDIGAAALSVTDGYHTGTDTSIYFIISLLDGIGGVMQPENPVLVKVPVPFGWKDGTVGIYRVGGDGSEEKISSFVEDGYIVFITDHFSEFAMVLDTEEPDDGGEDVPAVTEPEETTTEPEETEPEETTTTTPETTTEPVETTPETTTAPEETTTEVTTPEETTIEVAAPVESDIEPAESSAEVIETTTAPETAVPEITTAATAPNTTVPPVVTGSSAEETSEEETLEPEETDKSELPVEAILEVPSINVTVPSSITAIINPYGVPVNINGTEYGATGIASPVYTIINRTTTSGIKVMGTASLTVPVHQDTNEPAIQVVNSPAAVENQRVKSLCAYVLALTSTEQLDVYSTYELPDLFAQGDPRFDDSTLVFTDLTNDPYAEAGTGLIVELDKAESDEKFTYAQFKIAGDITSGDVSMWTSADVINLNLVLDLVPVENEEEAIEVDFDDTEVTVPDNVVTEEHKDILPHVPEFSFETAPGPVVTITPIDENAPI